MFDTYTYEARRAKALHILTHGERLTRRSGSFLGGLITDPTPMTEKQAEWFEQMAARTSAHTVEG